MKQKLISLLLAGVLAFSSCSKKQEKPKVMPRTLKRNVATVVQSVPEPRSELEDLLKTDIPPYEFVESFNPLNEEMKNYDNELDRKIGDIKINAEADKLRNYFNRYNNFVANFDSINPEAALRTADKLISDLEKERFNHEQELIRRFSNYNSYSGKNPFLSALRGYREKANERIKEKKMRAGTFEGVYKTKRLRDGKTLEFRCVGNSQYHLSVDGVPYSLNPGNFENGLRLFQRIQDKDVFRTFALDKLVPFINLGYDDSVIYDDAAVRILDKWRKKALHSKLIHRAYNCRQAVYDIKRNYHGRYDVKNKLISIFEALEQHAIEVQQRYENPSRRPSKKPKPGPVEYDDAARELKNKWDAQISDISRYVRGKRWDEKYDNKRRIRRCENAIIDVSSNYSGDPAVKKKLIEHFESIKRTYVRLDKSR